MKGSNDILSLSVLRTSITTTLATLITTTLTSTTTKATTTTLTRLDNDKILSIMLSSLP